MTPDEYCQKKAADSGSSFYYSFLFLPRQRRQAITALYAFCREIDDVVDECGDRGVAQTKLQWWRDEIDNLFASRPQHPASRALLKPVRRYNLAREYFLEIIDGMEMDLEQQSYPSFNVLALYCHRVAGVVGILTAEIFGYKDRNTLKYAHALGIAFQLTNILRDVREDAMRGRVYLPEDELQRFGVGRDTLLQPINNQAVTDLFHFQAQRAHDYYRKAFSYLPDQDRARQRSGLIMAEIYQSLLHEIEQDGYRVLEHRMFLSPTRKLWLAWKCIRREKQYLRKQRKAARNASGN